MHLPFLSRLGPEQGAPAPDLPLAGTHHQGGVVPAPDGLVESCHALPSPEVQVSSSVPQGLDGVRTVLQLGRHGQRAFCSTRPPGKRKATSEKRTETLSPTEPLLHGQAAAPTPIPTPQRDRAPGCIPSSYNKLPALGASRIPSSMLSVILTAAGVTQQPCPMHTSSQQGCHTATGEHLWMHRSGMPTATDSAPPRARNRC